MKTFNLVFLNDTDAREFFALMDASKGHGSAQSNELLGLAVKDAIVAQEGIKMTGHEWFDLMKHQCIDDDGWTRLDGTSLDTEITFADFMTRFNQSTVRPIR